jgi:hypothetical protein
MIRRQISGAPAILPVAHKRFIFQQSRFLFQTIGPQRIGRATNWLVRRRHQAYLGWGRQFRGLRFGCHGGR